MKIEDVTLDQVYEFMERGNVNNTPQHIVDYLLLLDKTMGMIRRIDMYGNREAVVKHLRLVDGLSDHKASKIYNEAIEYFNIDNEISKDAWRNFYADKMEKVINFSTLIMKDVADASKVVKMLLDVATLRQVNVPDAEKLPDNFFDKPVNLMSLDANIFEFGKANRQGIEAFIDSMPDLTEKEKIRIKQETLILPLKLFPDESENPRKS
jgi:hypothetical protein